MTQSLIDSKITIYFTQTPSNSQIHTDIKDSNMCNIKTITLNRYCKAWIL